MAEPPVILAGPSAFAPTERERRRLWVNPRLGVRRQTVAQVLPLLAVVVLAFLGPSLLPLSATDQDLLGRLQPPVWLDGGDWNHPLGTDGLGRDLLARIASGARTSLIVSIVAAAGAGVVGVTAGVLGGMRGGLTDRIITMLVETLLAVPFITVGIVVTGTVGQSQTNLLLLLVLSGWVTHARIVRLQVQSLVNADFVLAAIAMGADRVHVALRHLLPNLAPVIIVVLFQQAGLMLLWSASLTYLGIGLPIDEISLGGIVREGQELIYNAWWVSAFGGLAIALAVTGFNLFADWLQQRVDPTLR